MSSPVTFSGFNSIDFNVVLSAMMQQASQPLQDLQAKQSALQSQATNFRTLSTRVNALQTAASNLSSPDKLSALTATSSNPASLAVSTGTAAIAGHYDVVVQELARAQVTASNSTAPDADTTAVATGGTITINGTTVTLSGSSTLKQLAAAINDNADTGVNAAVVQSGAGAFKLVLTAKNTGAANAFTIANALTGGSGVTFTDTDGDGLSGNSDADNAVKATNAALLVNNIAVSSATNTIDSAIPGSTITLYKKDPAETIAVDVVADPAALKSKVQSFIFAYNDLLKFAGDQATTAKNGDPASIGRDPLLRQLRNSLRSTVNTSFAATGSADKYLSQVGIEFTQSGTMQLNDAKFTDAVKSGLADLSKLFGGTASTDGAFDSVKKLLESYTESDGIFSDLQDRLNAQIQRLGKQMDAMQVRLAAQRSALQQEFTAADRAMSQLKNQSGALSSFGASL